MRFQRLVTKVNRTLEKMDNAGARRDYRLSVSRRCKKNGGEGQTSECTTRQHKTTLPNYPPNFNSGQAEQTLRNFTPRSTMLGISGNRRTWLGRPSTSVELRI